MRSGLLQVVGVVELGRFYEHHLEAHWVKELLESVCFMQESEDLDIVVHDGVVSDPIFFLSFLSFLILLDH